MRGDASQTDVYKRAYRNLPNTLGPALERGLNFIVMKLKGLKYGGVDTEGHYWVDKNGVKYHEEDLPKKGERGSGSDEGDDETNPYVPSGESYGGDYGDGGGWSGDSTDSSVLGKGPALNTGGMDVGGSWGRNAADSGYANVSIADKSAALSSKALVTNRFQPNNTPGFNIPNSGTPIVNRTTSPQPYQRIARPNTTATLRSQGSSSNENPQNEELKKACGKCRYEKGNPAFKLLEWKKVEAQAKARQASPTLIDQLPLDLCAIAVATECLATYHSQGYFNIVYCLYYCGYVRHTNLLEQPYTINLNKKVAFTNPKKLLPQDNGHGKKQDEVDFMVLSSIKWSMNALGFHARSNLLEVISGATSPSQLVYLLENMVGLSEVAVHRKHVATIIRNDSRNFDAVYRFLTDVNDFKNAGGYAVFYINNDMVEQYRTDPKEPKHKKKKASERGYRFWHANHFVTYKGEFHVTLHISEDGTREQLFNFKVYHHGEVPTISLTAAEFVHYFHGLITARKKYEGILPFKSNKNG